MKTVKQEWYGYLDAAAPKKTSASQTQEIRDAFYAGSAMMMVLSMDMAETKDRDEFKANYLKVHSELTTYAEEKINEPTNHN